MTLRATVAVAAATGLLLSGAAASAAPKVCMLIVDDAGDGTSLAVVPNRDSLDILSGDIATGKKNLVAALRLKSVAADPTLPGGVTYTFRFTAGGVAYALNYRVFAGGEREGTISSGGALNESPVTAVVDPGTATITWTVPRKSVAGLKKPGTKIGSLSAATGVGNNLKLNGGGTRGSFGADLAETARTYVDGTPTCLRGV